MKAVGALPTEERVQKMNIRQWLWYYYNLVEDKKLETKRYDDIVDYLTTFINPELAEAVRQKRGDNKQDIHTTVNDSFEEELQQMLNGKELTELPSSSNYVSHMSEEEFVAKAQYYEEIARLNPNDPSVKMLPRNMRIKEQQMSEKQLLRYHQDDKDIMIVQQSPDA